MPRIKRRNFRKIIVLGGSFDPCHHGHIAISLQAKKCLQADYVWWVVTPKNPLKSAPTTQMTCRVARARAFVASHPIHVMMMQGQGIEYTHQMIATMQGRFAHCRFVWLMGADNWRQFHHWAKFRSLSAQIAIGIVPRGRDGLYAQTTKAARIMINNRAKAGPAFWYKKLPCWGVLPMQKNTISSTKIRREFL